MQDSDQEPSTPVIGRRPRYHRTKYVRTACPAPRQASNPQLAAQLWAQTTTLLWPWHLYEYPGWSHCASAAIGIKSETVRRWLYKGRRDMTAGSALLIATMLDAFVRRAQSLSDQWRAYAVAHEALEVANGWTGFRRQNAEGRDQTWRTKPRRKKK